MALGLEMRRRVKEQLKRLNPIEFSRVNLSYLDKNTGDEFVAECAELGASKLIPETPDKSAIFLLAMGKPLKRKPQ